MSDNQIKQLEQKIETLESQLAFQEDVIDQLNNEITTLNIQQQTIVRQITLLAEKITSQKGSNIASEADETPPPHY
jgi:SlyX protein|tara:strand:- start:169 stop:396 length:228 start_codon:yes stop_codon:yes gene_type:complete